MQDQDSRWTLTDAGRELARSIARVEAVERRMDELEGQLHQTAARIMRRYMTTGDPEDAALMEWAMGVVERLERPAEGEDRRGA